MPSRRILALLGAVAFALLASCVTVQSRPGELPPPVVPDAGAVDAGVEAHRLGDCHPTPGATGNALHVGAYCTKGGDECKAFPKGTATSCATDLSSRGGDFCIKLFCSDDSECGEGACCAGNGFAKACVPAGCFGDGGVCPK